jgi:hypothetical protein
VNVSWDISLCTGFAKRLTQPLYALATSVIQLAEFNEGGGANPYISHYLCMIWQICEERCLLFCYHSLLPQELRARGKMVFPQ